MKKIAFYSLAICTILVIVWGIFALPIVDVASQNKKMAEQHFEAEQRFEKAVERVRQLRYEDAIAEFEQVITLAPKSKIAHDAQYWIGQAYFRSGQYNAALTTFDKLIKDYPESAIIPVTQLMVGQVKQAKDNEKLKRTTGNESDIAVIVDPETGIKYTKVKTFTGKSDLIDWTPHAYLSPNGKFLLRENTIIPMDGSDPFELVNGLVGEPSWSPDGKNIAFLSNDSTISILPVSPETGRTSGPGKKILSGSYSRLGDISWSPNGEKIVFTICENKEYPDIWTLSVKDGSLNKITNDSIPQLNPTWSPDGTTIALRDLSGKIWSYPAEGGTPNMLIDQNKHRGSNWSPNGKWLFFDAQAYSAKTSLYFIRLSDKMEQTINPPENVGGFLSWTVDSKKALFYHSSYNIIWGMKVASSSGGASFEPVPYLPVYGARWNLDSKNIIVQGEDNKGDIAMRVVPLAGGESFLLEMDVTVDGKPFPIFVSPDLKKLLFIIEKDDKTDLYVVPVSITDARTTGPAVKVMEDWSCSSGFNANLSWSPDGNKLAVVHNGDIWISNLNGEKSMQITKTPEKENWPGWSPDGKMLSHKINFEKPDWKSEFRIIPAQGGKPIKTFKDCEKFRWCWLADSKSFAMISNDVISISPLGDGDTRKIFDLKSNDLDDGAYLCCSPDGKHLAFIGESQKGNYQDTEYQLYRISVENGEITKLATDNTDYIYSISWSPDGKWIYYLYEKMGKVRPEGTMWEADLEEFLEKL